MGSSRAFNLISWRVAAGPGQARRAKASARALVGIIDSVRGTASQGEAWRGETRLGIGKGPSGHKEQHMDNVIDADCTEASTDDETVEATEYPIATEHLAKGSRVSAETIERAFSVERGTDAYRFKAMGAQRYIEQRLAERDLFVTTCADHCDIVILTDEEALAYNARRFEAETRARDRAFRRLGHTDRAYLSDTSRAQLDRKIVELGRRVQDDRKAKRELTARPTPRATPAALPRPTEKS
jgi:hypothetical protein